jgi:hypothetical protein
MNFDESLQLPISLPLRYQVTLPLGEEPPCTCTAHPTVLPTLIVYLSPEHRIVSVVGAFVMVMVVIDVMVFWMTATVVFDRIVKTVVEVTVV